MKTERQSTFLIWLRRRIVFVILDIAGIIGASYLALLIRFEFSYSLIFDYYLIPMERALVFAIPLTILIFYFFRLYHSLWVFAGEKELQNIVFACLLSTVCYGIILQFYRMDLVAEPKSFYILYAFILLAEVFITRFTPRFLKSSRSKQEHKLATHNVMIIGAGEAGNMITKELASAKNRERNVRCIIDDNPATWGSFVQGVRVIGGRERIVECADLYSIEEIIVAIPELRGEALSELLNVCKEANCKLRVLPGVYQMVSGEVDLNELRDVDVEDLLGRDSVRVDIDSIAGYVRDKVVLVTGGGGSIGAELCRQIASHMPSHLVILDIYENSVYEIQQELEHDFPDVRISIRIASVRDARRMNEIFALFRPDIVYHAAAHKHVPLMEDAPAEAVKNNIFGTRACAMAAATHGVKRFVLISTDKAVNPTNIMGATKRVCEMIVQALNREYETEFVAVRFGNVLGSNGSVIPLFKKQIAMGGPVTVTDPEIIRYFMTIPEAVSLVLQAGAYAKGGEIFVLDMGKPVRILDLAENLIKLSGYRVGADIEITFTGLRPGEKLYEEMLMDEEGLKETENELIHIGRPLDFDEEQFFRQLERLEHLVTEGDATEEEIREMMKEIVPTYHRPEEEE